MIYFITSNKDKYNYASKELLKYNISLKQKNLSINEIQSSDIKRISLDKSIKAFKIIKTPLIVTDTGWNIPSLNGFPGAYMHDITRWLKSNDFLNLMKDKNEKTILFNYIAIYKDNLKSKLFNITLNGEFLEKSKGKNGSTLDKVVTFRKDKKTIAECEDKNITFHDFPEHPLWKKVGKWLKSNSIY